MPLIKEVLVYGNSFQSYCIAIIHPDED